MWQNIIIYLINHPTKEITTTKHLNNTTILCYALAITMAIVILTSIVVGISMRRHRKNNTPTIAFKELFIIMYKKLFSKIKYPLIIFTIIIIIFTITAIILEVIKLMEYQNYGFIQSFNHIKTLGYMLGGILAIIGLSLSYKRLQTLEKQIKDNKTQHDQTLKEEKFKNAVELLSSEISTSRIIGAHSLVEVTLDNKNNKFLDNNVTILLLHLENIYNLEIQSVLEYYNKSTINNKSDIDKYILYNYTTSQEIILTLEHIMKLINHIKDDYPHTNKQYKLNIPLYYANINFDKLIFKNITFTKQLHNVRFHQELGIVNFYQELTNIKFHQKLDNIKFYQKLTNVCFDQELNKIEFYNKLKIIRFYEELNNIKFYSKLDDVHFHQKLDNVEFHQKLHKIRFCQELTNVIFKKKVKNVDFNKELTNVEFHEKLEKIYFHEKLNNVVFYGNLNNVNFPPKSHKISYHKDIVNDIITQHMKNILNNNYIISITINNKLFNELIEIRNNITQDINITFKITIDDQPLYYNQTLHYNIDTKDLLDNDNNIYDEDHFNNDLRKAQSHPET